MTMNGDMTVSAALERASEQMNMANLAENTRQSYRQWMRSFFDCVDKDPCEVTAEDVRGWVLGRIESGPAPGPVNIAAAALRLLFRDALDRPDLVKGIRSQKIPRKLPRHMSVEEFERLILAVIDIRYRTAITLAYGAGLRISEAVGVKVSDIIADRNLLHIPSGRRDRAHDAPARQNGWPPARLLEEHPATSGVLKVLRRLARPANQHRFIAQGVQHGPRLGRHQRQAHLPCAETLSRVYSYLGLRAGITASR